MNFKQLAILIATSLSQVSYGTTADENLSRIQKLEKYVTALKIEMKTANRIPYMEKSLSQNFYSFRDKHKPLGLTFDLRKGKTYRISISGLIQAPKNRECVDCSMTIFAKFKPDGEEPKIVHSTTELVYKKNTSAGATQAFEFSKIITAEKDGILSFDGYGSLDLFVWGGHPSYPCTARVEDLGSGFVKVDEL
jgi:hypothetical protein